MLLCEYMPKIQEKIKRWNFELYMPHVFVYECIPRVHLFIGWTVISKESTAFETHW